MNALILLKTYWKQLVVVLVLALAGRFLYVAGQDSLRAEYAKRDSKAASDHLAALNKAYAERDAAIAKRTELQAASSAAYQTLEREKKNAEDKLAAAVANGTRRLFVTAKCPTGPDSGDVSGPSSDPGGLTTPVRVELARGTSDDLVRYGRRINSLQRQYNYCYQTLINDRK